MQARRHGRPALGNPVLASGAATLVNALLAIAVLLGLALNTFAGARRADPAAALVIVWYRPRKARRRRAGGRQDSLARLVDPL